MEKSKEFSDSKFLGVYQKQSFWVAVMSFFVHSFTTIYGFYNKLSLEEFVTLSPEQESKYYTWYVYYPTIFLGIIFMNRYFDYVTRNVERFRWLKSFFLSMIVSFLFIFIFTTLSILFLY